MANFSMPWVEADFRRKTLTMSRLQREAYRSLLQACFDCEGVLPDDDKLLARICNLDVRTFRRHRPVLEPFFYTSPDGWRHHRIDEDLARLAKQRDRLSAIGQKGGLVTAMRWYRKK